MKTTEQKRTEAEDRQVRYDRLSLAEKLGMLGNRPGNSLRERARLMSRGA